MAYRFKLTEPIDDGVRRIGMAQIDRAVTYLASSAADASVSIHETRKCLKRVRALLRFTRSLVAIETFKDTNAALRDIGRALSAARDFDVLTQTVQKLGTEGVLKAVVVRKLLGLTTRARSSNEVASISAGQLQDLVARLTMLRQVIATMPIDRSNTTLPLAGLARTLNDCRDAYKVAMAGDDDAALHEWRKAIQNHWRHLQLVNRAWPAFLDSRLIEAREISLLAGYERDLGLLQKFVTAHGDAKLAAPMVQSITLAIAKQRQKLRLEAKLRGERLLAGSTKGFCRRLTVYWSAAVLLRDFDRPAVARERPS